MPRLVGVLSQINPMGIKQQITLLIPQKLTQWGLILHGAITILYGDWILLANIPLPVHPNMLQIDDQALPQQGTGRELRGEI